MELLRRVASVLAGLWVAMWPACARALDPALEMSQYGHTAWRNIDGFGPGTIQPIAQTVDGYLWLGGPLGLVRFDGVKTVPWQPPAGSALPDHRIRALLGTSDGALWIGTLRGLASWKDGKLSTYAALDGKYINAIVEDGDGIVWAAGSDERNGVLCAVRAGASECETDGLGRAIMSLYRDAAGALWVGGTDRVWRWKPDRAVYPLPAVIATLGSLTAAPEGGILAGTTRGIVRIAADRVEPYSPATLSGETPYNKLLCDRNGALWMGVIEGGLQHQHQGRIDTFTRSDGLSDDQVYGLFEDREGNVWVSTRGGIDRFRPMAAPAYGRAQGVRGRFLTVLAARDGSVWASSSIALYRLRPDRMTEVMMKGGVVLFEDRRGRLWTGLRLVRGRVAELGYVEGDRFVSVETSTSPQSNFEVIGEDGRGDTWAVQPQSLLRVRDDGKLERKPWTDLVDKGHASTLAPNPLSGGLLLGFRTGAVIELLDGKVRTIVAGGPDQVASRTVNHMRVDGEGSLWVATENGLSRIRDGSVTRLDHSSGMPCDSVYASLEDRESTWMYTGCGLVSVARADMAAWTSAASRGAPYKISPRVLDHWDGIRTDIFMNGVGQLPEPRPYSPRMARTADGLIWVALADGIGVVDPAHLPFNAMPPPVHVERIVADGTPYQGGDTAQLPAQLRNLEIHYTGLSLTVPEKVRFKYKLEGRDAQWQDAGNRRSAFYTDLPPGDYRFRVIAANNSGVWNEQGASLQFSIARVWWQTYWFRAASVAALALAIWLAYRMRMMQLAHRAELTLEARVNERTRIARDLHDTLLQSFHGLLLGFQTALQLWPRPEGRDMLEKTIDHTAEAITRGRDAVRGLRAAATEPNDLAESIRTLGETLCAEYGSGGDVGLRVEVQGVTRPLRPVVRDELFRIAGEALRNAFLHADAKRIELEIRYDKRRMSVHVRDDGKGIDRETLSRGARDGHFGLAGMRERAKLIGAKLAIWSAGGSGTEVELIIPASHAYAGPPTMLNPSPG